MENILFSLNVMAPLFIMVLLGHLMKRFGFLDDDFLNKANRFAFQFAFPASVFSSLYSTEFTAQDVHLILFSIAGLILFVVALMIFAPKVIKNPKTCGAFIQACHRGSYVVISLPLANNIFGPQGLPPLTAMMPTTIVLFNVFAVIVLSVFSEEKREIPIKKILHDIATNPILWGAVLGLLFALSPFTMPSFGGTVIRYFANLATPLALLALGGQLNYKEDKPSFKIVGAACLTKLVVLPAVLIAAAAALGFGSKELFALFLIHGSPTTVSSYVMAKAMDSDASVTSAIILFTTFLSAFTMFMGIFIFRTLGLI